MKDKKILDDIHERIAIDNFKKETKRQKNNKKIFFITLSTLTLVIAGLMVFDVLAPEENLDYI